MGNSEVAQLLIKVMLMTFGLMAVIMICCVITPKLAKWIDSHRRPTQDGGTDSVRAENETPAPEGEPTVRGPFDKSSEPEYDLNYKIYNKDIYGVDFKHGKEKNG